MGCCHTLDSSQKNFQESIDCSLTYYYELILKPNRVTPSCPMFCWRINRFPFESLSKNAREEIMYIRKYYRTTDSLN